MGQLENGGFGLAAELAVNVPNVPQEKAQALVEKAHQVCPYSNAILCNISKIVVTNN
jgi:organic hydroperoxide reductase OsmC/OhrA